jgi:ubiquinone/menaquinone biosynthesis C-methylase UbiE
MRAATGDTIRPGGLTLLKRALELFPLPPGARVLDVGCGTGASTAYLRQRHQLRAAGVDFSAKLLSEGSAVVPGLPLIRGKAENLPCRPAFFSGLLCECVLSLVADYQATLREFHRALQPGGTLIVSDLYRRAAAKEGEPQLPAHCCVARARSQAAIRHELAAACFELLLWEDHSPLLGNLAARLVFTHGSLKSFWQKLFGESAGQSVNKAIETARPGYFLLVARKPI